MRWNAIFVKILMYTLLSLATDLAQNECAVDIGVSSREWRSALENQFQSGFTENIENTVTDYVFMTVYRNMCVVRIIGKKTFFQKNEPVRIVR